MATEAPDGALGRMRKWLGAGWGLAELRKFEFPIEDYIFSNILSSGTPPEQQEGEYERWLDSYEEHGIEKMVSAQYFAVKLPPGQPDWECSRDIAHPSGPQGEEWDQWLNER